MHMCVQREERKILREWKAWLDQLERDILRAQGAEGNLTEKYQVTQQAVSSHGLSALLNVEDKSILISLVHQAFKNFRVQYEMRKKQIETLLQPVNKDGKLSVDQAVVKQAWEHVSVRVLISHHIITVHLVKDKQPLCELLL